MTRFDALVCLTGWLVAVIAIIAFISAAKIGDRQASQAIDRMLTGRDHDEAAEVIELPVDRSLALVEDDVDERLAETFAPLRRERVHLVHGGDEPGLGGAA